jgi:hypothetical protein
MAKIKDVIGSPEQAADVSEIFGAAGQTHMPKPIAYTHPDIVASANAGLGAATPSLTPQSLNQRLPNIVNSTPSNVSTGCDSFSDWVSQNTLLAAGLLAGAAMLLWRHKK